LFEGERKWSWWTESRDSWAYHSGEWFSKGKGLVGVAVHGRKTWIEEYNWDIEWANHALVDGEIANQRRKWIRIIG
jgi:hypothetical protein